MKIIPITLLFLIFTSCIKSQTIESESFTDFNNKFHSDSIFQMSRIKFPINGKLYKKDIEENWNMNNWTMLRKPVGEYLFKQFKQETITKDDSVEEKISYAKIGFYYYVKFELIKNKWYLVKLEKTEL